jgi:hypothetical protein
MIETDMDRLARRVDSLYGQREKQPDIPAVYFVMPPTSKLSEMDEAKSLVLLFLRELPGLALELAAFALVVARRAWRWCRQWKRTPKGG